MDETVEYTNACSDMSNVQFFMLDGRTCEVIFFCILHIRKYIFVPQNITCLRNFKNHVAISMIQIRGEYNSYAFLPFLHFHVVNIKIPLLPF